MVKRGIEFDSPQEGRSNGVVMSSAHNERPLINRAAGAGVTPGAWGFQRRRRGKKPGRVAPWQPEELGSVDPGPVSESQSRVMISELSLDPVFEEAAGITSETTTSFRSLPNSVLEDSAISLPRLSLPTLPAGSFGLSPEPSLPGSAWSVGLAEAMLVRVPSRTSATLVMPGEWVPPGQRGFTSHRTAEEPSFASVADFEFESAELESLVEESAQGTEEELDSSELEELELAPTEGQEAEEAEGGASVPSALAAVDLRLHTEPTYRSEDQPLVKKKRGPLRPKFDSPTLRAVARTLARDEESTAALSEPSRLRSPVKKEKSRSARRVVMELGDPEGRADDDQEGGLGEDSVWLEFGDPAQIEATTQRQPPPQRGQPTADVLADGGAVRVDLSLGRSGTPDIDARRRSSDGELVPRRSSKSTAAASPPEDLRGLVGAARSDLPDLLAQEVTEQGGLLEDQVTEGVWDDGF